MLHEMREVFVVDAQHKIKIEGLEKAQDVIFEKIRLLDAENEKSRREKIDPLIDWKNQMQGSMVVFKVIPIACVIITTIVGLYTVLIGAN